MKHKQTKKARKKIDREKIIGAVVTILFLLEFLFIFFGMIITAERPGVGWLLCVVLGNVIVFGAPILWAVLYDRFIRQPAERKKVAEEKRERHRREWRKRETEAQKQELNEEIFNLFSA